MVNSPSGGTDGALKSLRAAWKLALECLKFLLNPHRHCQPAKLRAQIIRIFMQFGLGEKLIFDGNHARCQSRERRVIASDILSQCLPDFESNLSGVPAGAQKR